MSFSYLQPSPINIWGCICQKINHIFQQISHSKIDFLKQQNDSVNTHGISVSVTIDIPEEKKERNINYDSCYDTNINVDNKMLKFLIAVHPR